MDWHIVISSYLFISILSVGHISITNLDIRSMTFKKIDCFHKIRFSWNIVFF